MLERTGQIVRIACFVLAALLVYQVARVVLRGGLLARVVIPQLPTLASDTNAPSATSGTNTAKLAAKTTNSSGGLPATNALASKAPSVTGTNPPAAAQPSGATNVAVNRPVVMNPAPSGLAENPLPRPEPAGPSTNPASKAELDQTTPVAATQSPSNAVASGGSNVLSGASGTNSLPVSNTNLSVISTNPASNLVAKAGSGKKDKNAGRPGAMAGPGMSFPGMPGMSPKAPQPLPPEIKARVDRIYESQFLSPIIRVPMALLGIAGDSAILRSPSGQTGLVKEGGTLGDIKLLRIGINRVLVQQDEQKQELMIFNGYGGKSLLTNENEPK